MGMRCCYRGCKSDYRYPDRLNGGRVKFVPFPKPKTQFEKCVRWISRCGRPRAKLSPEKIARHHYVCTKHFHNQSWPTEEFPDPLQAELFSPQRKPARALKTRTLFQTPDGVLSGSTTNRPVHPLEEEKENIPASPSVSCQTTNAWADPLDVIMLTADNRRLQQRMAKSALEVVDHQRHVIDLQNQLSDSVKKIRDTPKTLSFSVDQVLESPNLIRYYTGLSKEAFLTLYKLLIPDEETRPFDYIMKGNIRQTSHLSLQDQLFLTLCKLRLNLDFVDLSFRFGVTQQVAGILFKTWINYMFLRLGEIPIWPHRDTISENMPGEFKKEFPTTFAILDCTEIRTEKPSSLKTQSQTYSDYKSANTLKALVAVDPRGSVIFSSMLFGGSMSDKEIFLQSGLQQQLKDLVNCGYLNAGDAVMGDKGFNIEQDVRDAGLELNIPPFASCTSQMAEADVIRTRKIAKHRVHVERAIRRIKTFKILSQRIPACFMSSVNQIWYVCSFLTNFMPLCIKKM